jgi:2,3-bisphosphoglycerate-independent phosphoglycerate mutase
VDANGLITDRRAGRIPTEEAAPIVEKLSQIKLPGVVIEIKHVKEHRFAVVLRGDGLYPDLEETDPQKVGVAPYEVKAKKAAAKKTADLYNMWVAEARKLLKNEPKANALTLRGFATDPGLESYMDRYALKAACVAVYPMYKGVAQLVGMEVVNFEGETPTDEFKALGKVWNEYDFFFIHIKKTDSYGEDGNFDAKVHVIESVDEAIPELKALNPDVFIITGDHSTPALLKSHSWHPVPFLLWAPGTARADEQTKFGEKYCLQGGLGTFNALEAMPLALGHALRFNKYGA